MIHVSQPDTAAPEMFRTPLQAQVYRTLDALGIPFSRVDTDEAITMADCAAIDAGAVREGGENAVPVQSAENGILFVHYAGR